MQRALLCPRPPYSANSTLSPFLRKICPVIVPELARVKQARPFASPSPSTSTQRIAPLPTLHTSPSNPLDTDEKMATSSETHAHESTGSLFWDSQLSVKEAFLASIANPSSSEPWTVVMGNEAGDLDSMASALAHAYLLNTVDGKRAVALVLTPRQALRLRPENELALKLTRPDSGHETLGSLEDVLLCADDLPVSASTLISKGVKFALVDHNSLLPPFRPEGESANTNDSAVTAILDHHADDGNHLSASPRTVELAGSCASIVGSYWAHRLPVGTQGLGGQPLLPSEVAKLLLSAILIDTNGLKAGGKALDIDWKAVEFLWPLTGMAAADETTSSSIVSISAASRSAPARLKQLADELNEVKNNVSHLTLSDLLARDYKSYAIPSAYFTSSDVHLGLASVPLSLKSILTREKPSTDWSTLVDSLETFARAERLTLVGVLTSYKSETKNKRKRELLLYSPSTVPSAEVDHLWNSFVPRLESSAVLDLGEWKVAAGEKSLPGWGTEWKGGRGQVWSQKQSDATRKQVAPVLKEALGGVALDV